MTEPLQPQRPSPSRTSRRRRIGIWAGIGCGGIVAFVAFMVLLIILQFILLLVYAFVVGDGDVHGALRPGSSLTVTDPEDYRVTVLQIEAPAGGAPGYVVADGTSVWGVLVRIENTSGGRIYLDYPSLQSKSGRLNNRLSADDALVPVPGGSPGQPAATAIQGWVYFELGDGDAVESLVFFGRGGEPDIYFDAE